MLKNDLMNDPLNFFDDLSEDLKNEMELDSLLVDLACSIINYRIDNNITQKDLAEKLDISQAMVSKIESGDYNPSVGFLFNISKKLGLNLIVEFRKSPKVIPIVNLKKNNAVYINENKKLYKPEK